MKNRLLLLVALLVAVTTVTTAQPKKAYKFGNISAEELAMTQYEADPDAEAVVLYDYAYIDYEFFNGSVYKVMESIRRVKILKEEGFKYGELEIELFDTSERKETLKGFSASAFNLIDGKRVESKLKRQDLIKEQTSEYSITHKATIPDVRVGTVIEYHYTVQSDLIEYIPTLFFQEEIPILLAEAKICTPQYFQFRMQQLGGHPVTTRRSASAAIATVAPNVHETYMVNQIDAVAKDVPALRKVPCLWNLNEYRAKLEFDLSAIEVPGGGRQSMNFTWKEIYDVLEKLSFGEYATISNPLGEELKAALPADADEQSKIRTALTLLSERVEWNEEYAVLGDTPRRALHAKTGSSAEINFLLMAMLRDLGFDPKPVLLSSRENDRLRQSVTLDDLDCFIVRVVLGDGTICYLDGTNPNNDLNLMPIELLTDRARIYGDTETVLDLTALTRNSHTESISTRFNPDLTLHVEKTRHDTGLEAFEENLRYDSFEDEAAYFAAMSDELGAPLTSHSLKRTKSLVTTQLAYDKPMATIDGRIKLNITVEPALKENPFTHTERKLPIEFEFPCTHTVRCNIQLPEGYVVEELPRSTRMAGCNGDLMLTFIAQAAGNIIQTSYTFQLKRAVFTATEYPDLKAFFDHLTELANSSIVLKRAE